MTFSRLVPRTLGQWCVAGLLAVGIGLLLVDHWAHAFGFLPYLVILACPLMHLFMHHGHGHHHGGSGSQGATGSEATGEGPRGNA